jgi:hypothetical protein
MQCPKCQLENPSGIPKCSCGYDFEAKPVQRSNVAPSGVGNLRPSSVSAAYPHRVNRFAGFSPGNKIPFIQRPSNNDPIADVERPALIRV